ncbi:MAG TPA: bleomycin resistance family protein [Terriglobales bacterium]
MVDKQNNHFEGAIPILNVSNVPASVDYYVNHLGFTMKWQWGEPPTFACVGRDKVTIYLCEGAQGQPGTWIMIFVEDVDALYADYRQRGAKVVQPPTNMPWETREMNVEDPDGHRLRFGGDATGPADPNEVKRYWDAVQLSDR